MRILIGCWVLLIGSCGATYAQKKNGRELHPAPAANQEVQNQDINRLIYNKLGPGTDKSYNTDKQFALFKKDTLNDSSIPVLKYAVVRNADGRVIIEGSVTMGSIDWTADYELTEKRSLGAGQPAENQKQRKIDLRPYIVKP